MFTPEQLAQYNSAFSVPSEPELPGYAQQFTNAFAPQKRVIDDPNLLAFNDALDGGYSAPPTPWLPEGGMSGSIGSPIAGVASDAGAYGGYSPTTDGGQSQMPTAESLPESPRNPNTGVPLSIEAPPNQSSAVAPIQTQSITVAQQTPPLDGGPSMRAESYAARNPMPLPGVPNYGKAIQQASTEGQRLRQDERALVAQAGELEHEAGKTISDIAIADAATANSISESDQRYLADRKRINEDYERQRAADMAEMNKPPPDPAAFAKDNELSFLLGAAISGFVGGFTGKGGNDFLDRADKIIARNIATEKERYERLRGKAAANETEWGRKLAVLGDDKKVEASMYVNQLNGIKSGLEAFKAQNLNDAQKARADAALKGVDASVQERSAAALAESQRQAQAAQAAAVARNRAETIGILTRQDEWNNKFAEKRLEAGLKQQGEGVSLGYPQTKKDPATGERLPYLDARGEPAALRNVPKEMMPTIMKEWKPVGDVLDSVDQYEDALAAFERKGPIDNWSDEERQKLKIARYNMQVNMRRSEGSVWTEPEFKNAEDALADIYAHGVAGKGKVRAALGGLRTAMINRLDSTAALVGQDRFGNPLKGRK